MPATITTQHIAFFRTAVLRHQPQRHARMVPPGLDRKYDDYPGPLTDAQLREHLQGEVAYAVPTARDGRCSLLYLDLDGGGEAAVWCTLDELKRRGLWGFGEYHPRPDWPEHEQRGYVLVPIACEADPERVRLLGLEIIAAVGSPGAESRASNNDTRLPLARHTHTGQFGMAIIDGQVFDHDAPRAEVLDALMQAWRPNDPACLPELPPPPQPTPRKAWTPPAGSGITIQTFNATTDLRSLLEHYQARRSSNALYLCPFHDDKHASLSVFEHNGQLYCHCKSAHSACPLAERRRNDAFNVFCIAEGLDTKAALRRLNGRPDPQNVSTAPPASPGRPAALPAPCKTPTAPQPRPRRFTPVELVLIKLLQLQLAGPVHLSELEAQLEKSARQLRRYFRELEEAGQLAISNHRNAGNAYQLTEQGQRRAKYLMSHVRATSIPAAAPSHGIGDPGIQGADMSGSTADTSVMSHVRATSIPAAALPNESADPSIQGADMSNVMSHVRPGHPAVKLIHDPGIHVPELTQRGGGLVRPLAPDPLPTAPAHAEHPASSAPAVPASPPAVPQTLLDEPDERGAYHGPDGAIAWLDGAAWLPTPEAEAWFLRLQERKKPGCVGQSDLVHNPPGPAAEEAQPLPIELPPEATIEQTLRPYAQRRKSTLPKLPRHATPEQASEYRKFRGMERDTRRSTAQRNWAARKVHELVAWIEAAGPQATPIEALISSSPPAPPPADHAPAHGGVQPAGGVTRRESPARPGTAHAAQERLAHPDLASEAQIAAEIPRRRRGTPVLSAGAAQPGAAARAGGPDTAPPLRVHTPRPGECDESWIGYQRWLADHYEAQGQQERAAFVRSLLGEG